MKKIGVLVLWLMGVQFAIAQQELNNYKYVIVPKQFTDFKKVNQYKTSTLVKFLLTKHNFETFYTDNLPADLMSNRCLGVKAELLNESSMFTTKTILTFKDCGGKEVYRTIVGKSKLKEYVPAFSEAIRRSLQSLNGFNYSYKPLEEARKKETIVADYSNDIKKVETEASNEIKMTNATIVRNVTLSPIVEVPVVENVNQNIKTLYAQPLGVDGYQLVDSTPKVVCKIFKSSIKDVFLVYSEETPGVLYQSNGVWYLEYRENGKQKIEKLNIKF